MKRLLISLAVVPLAVAISFLFPSAAFAAGAEILSYVYRANGRMPPRTPDPAPEPAPESAHESSGRSR